jgi:hypothetical protein
MLMQIPSSLPIPLVSKLCHVVNSWTAAEQILFGQSNELNDWRTRVRTGVYFMFVAPFEGHEGNLLTSRQQV